MRRFTFYILAAFFTFAVGCLIVFGLFYKEKSKEIKTEIKVNSQVITTENNSSTALDYDIFKAQYEDKFPEPAEKQKPFCNDKKILPVWNLIQKDEYFRRQSGEEFSEPNCSKMFEFLYFDLNNDGNKEIILRGKSSDLCGAVGNCGFWIFEKKGKKYQKILSSSDYVDITEMGKQITRRKTTGYYDLSLKAHWSASETRYSTFKFDGQEYKESKCIVETCAMCTNDNLKWETISCREYQERNNY